MPPTYTHEGAVAPSSCGPDHPDLGVLLLSQAVETHFAAAAAASGTRERFGYLLTSPRWTGSSGAFGS